MAVIRSFNMHIRENPEESSYTFANYEVPIGQGSKVNSAGSRVLKKISGYGVFLYFLKLTSLNIM